MSTTSFLYDHPRRTLLLATLVCVLPILILGYPTSSHDFLFHMQWTREFAEQFWSGELYPRWLDGLNNGHGSPSFYYYPPMEGFLSVFLYPLAPLDPLGNIRVGLLASIATFLSGLAAWWWLSRYTSDRRYRLWGSLLYMLGPYHFGMDVYFRGALAESLAFLFFPLILGSLADMVERNGRPLFPVLLPASLALLFITHLLSGMMLIPFLILYVLMVPPRGERIAGLLRLGLAGLLAAGGAAIYLLPALMQVNWVNIPLMFGDYSESFLPGLWIFFDDPNGMRLNTALLNLCLFLLFAFGLHAFLRRGREWLLGSRRTLFWGIMLASGLLMSTTISLPVWFVIEPLQRLQFPWRFMSIATCALAPFLVLALDGSSAAPASRGLRSLVRHLFSLPTLVAFTLVYSLIIVGYRYLVADESPNVVEAGKNSLKWHIDAKEYTPPCLPDPVHRITPEFERTVPIHYARVEGGRGVPVEGFRLTGEGRDLLLIAEPLEQPVYVTLHRYYYPIWQASAGGEAIATQCSSPNGLLELRLPPGTTRVEISMVPSRWERLGGWISLASVLLILGLALIRWRRPSRQAPRPDSGRDPRQ